jgi:hypothetical protein
MPDVAGLRVLRVLSRGARADSLLAFDPEAGPEGDGDESARGPGVAVGEAVVIKRFHPATPSGDVARELEALARADGDHVVMLRDVGSESGCACLVFERLPGGDLTTLLRMRGSLDPGEVVTVLAPIAGALARMHAAGVAHGAVTASAILFTADGSPTLTGFGAAVLFPPGSPEVVLESVAGVATDREGLRALAGAMLGRVSAPGAAELMDAVARAAPDELFELVGTRLFEFATPIPVRFESDDRAGGTRAVPVAVTASVPSAESPAQSPARSTAGRGVLGRLESLARLGETDVVARLREELTRRWHSLSPRYRRLLIAAVAGIGVLVIALAAVPTPAPPDAAPAATPSTGSAPIPVGSDAGPDPELTSDDPAAAARVLLARRGACLRSASLLCLDGVVQAGSSAEAADRAAVSVIQGGGEAPPPIDAPAIELVERLGDSALVSLGGPPSGETAPASLLLIKGEAGWRIRDYVSAP